MAGLSRILAPMPDVRIELSGLAESQRALRILAEGLRDLRPFWPRLVPVFIRWMREQFDSEGRWGGEEWAPLSPAYAEWKASHYPGKPILQATGDLRQAASRPRRVVTARTFSLLLDDSGYRHGGPAAKAVGPFHQFGGGSAEVGEIATRSIPGRPPRRRIIPDLLPAAATVEVAELGNEYVRSLARRLGL